MCQCNRIADDPQARQHRRNGILLAAGTACLGGIPSLFFHLHRPAWLPWTIIATQILLLVLALRQLSLARRSPNPGC